MTGTKVEKTGLKFKDRSGTALETNVGESSTLHAVLCSLLQDAQ